MNMKAIRLAAYIAVASTLALVGCDQASAPEPAADGYVFGEAEWPATAMTLIPVEYDTQRELRAFAEGNDVSVEEGQELMAFSFIYPDVDECHVHYVKPEVDYQPEWLGHEVAHCLYGRWHPQ